MNQFFEFSENVRNITDNYIEVSIHDNIRIVLLEKYKFCRLKSELSPWILFENSFATFSKYPELNLEMFQDEFAVNFRHEFYLETELPHLVSILN